MFGHLIWLHVVEDQRHFPLLYRGGWGLVVIYMWASTNKDRQFYLLKTAETYWKCGQVMEIQLGIRSKVGSHAGGVCEGRVCLLSL